MTFEGIHRIALAILALAFALSEPTLGQSAPGENQNQATIRLPDAVLNREYQAAIPVSSAVGVVDCRVVAGALPTGLAFHGPWLAGRPGEVGQFSFDVLAGDQVKQQTRARFLLDVVPPPAQPLKVVDRPLPECPVFSRYMAVLQCQGGSPPYGWAITQGSLPTGLMLKDGQIVGQVMQAISQSEESPFSATVKDSADSTAMGKYVLKLTPQPQMELSVNLPAGEEPIRQQPIELPMTILGQAYRVHLPVRGGVGTLRWTAAGQLPPGIEHHAGWLTGRPQAIGQWSFQAAVEDEAGQNLQAAFRLAVHSPSAEPPRIVTRQLPVALSSQPYEVLLAAVGGVQPVRWDHVGGSLPAGLTLNADGLLHGTPATEGSWTVDLHVADALGQGDTARQLELRVAKFAPHHLGLGNIGNLTAVTGRPFEYALPAWGGMVPYRFSSDGLLPDGLRLDPQTGVLSGVPRRSGACELTLSVTDNSPQPAQVQAKIAIDILEAGTSAWTKLVWLATGLLSAAAIWVCLLVGRRWRRSATSSLPGVIATTDSPPGSLSASQEPGSSDNQ